jgi:prepilin-type N-terminal cleavage/methylation domain-containing protein
MSRGHRREGFTLIEVLVASMLLSIVMTAVYTLFFAVISTWRSEENDEGLHRRARSLLALVERDYNNLHGGGSYLFEGGEEEVTLYIVAPPMDVESGEGRRLMKVRYRFDKKDGTVVRDEALVEGALPATAEAAEEVGTGRIEVTDEASFVVATGVSKFDLRYVWIQRPDSTYWQSKPEPVTPLVAKRHESGWGLPQAIQIDLALRGGDDSTPPLEFEARIPTRTMNRQRDAWELARMLEGEP